LEIFPDILKKEEVEEEEERQQVSGKRMIKT